MPSHPDRVRRNYEPEINARGGPKAQSVLVTCDCDHPEHCAACDRYHLPPVGPECPYRAITDTGFTANVIEGEHHD